MDVVLLSRKQKLTDVITCVNTDIATNHKN